MASHVVRTCSSRPVASKNFLATSSNVEGTPASEGVGVEDEDEGREKGATAVGDGGPAGRHATVSLVLRVPRASGVRDGYSLMVRRGDVDGGDGGESRVLDRESRRASRPERGR